jgi:hypothetical protein
MDNNQLIKQAIDYNRNLFNNTFSAWELVYGQIERLSTTAISQASWMPEEGRNAITQWLDACKTGRENYRNNVDAGFDKLEELLGAGARA